MWFELEPKNILAERIGTYGVIKGADAFLIGIRCEKVENQKDAAINFGYDFEQIVLKATELGLGTCWIAYNFKPTGYELGGYVTIQPTAVPPTAMPPTDEPPEEPPPPEEEPPCDCGVACSTYMINQFCCEYCSNCEWLTGEIPVCRER